MAKTVEEGFRIFHSRLTPTRGESEAAKSHRASIEVCLKKNFEITRFFRTGSFGNGTSIRGYSDVDYFASIPTKNLKQNSGVTLRAVRDALDAHFPNTGVRVSTPAVLVPFGTDASESTEVVPAGLSAVDCDAHCIYKIADGAGGWIRSSPDAHNAYVTDINDKLRGKVKTLIRFLKAWKYYQNVPIYSFYLELQIANYASGEKSILYSIDVKNVLKMLWDNQLAAIQDPLDRSGYIYPCSTGAKKYDALSKLVKADVYAEKAREAEAKKNIREVFSWWNLVFAKKFPAYD